MDQCLLALAYLRAKETVLAAGFGAELRRSSLARFGSLGETDFLREAAWVILSAGMKASIVEARFPAVSASFRNWCSASVIARHAEECYAAALGHFAHEKKIRSIVSLCQELATEDFELWSRGAYQDPVTSFQQFGFIGPVTAFHLAKNLGFDVAKPDRHLVRLAFECGYDDVQRFCSDIGGFVGDEVSMVDSVLWRFATLQRDYLCQFSRFQHR